MSQMKPHDYCYIYPDSLNTKRELYHWGSFAWNTTTCVRTSLTAATVVWTASCWSSCWEAMETSSHSATRLSEWSLKWASHTLTLAAASHYYDHNECSMTLAMGFICSHILHHNIITVHVLTPSCSLVSAQLCLKCPPSKESWTMPPSPCKGSCLMSTASHRATLQVLSASGR